MFKGKATKFPHQFENRTLLVSPDDKAVAVSKWAHKHDRVGIAPPVTTVSGVETIEVRGFGLLELGHGYFASVAPVIQDIREAIETGKGAGDRKIPRDFGLILQSTSGRTIKAHRISPKKGTPLSSHASVITLLFRHGKLAPVPPLMPASSQNLRRSWWEANPKRAPGRGGVIKRFVSSDICLDGQKNGAREHFHTAQYEFFLH